MQKYTTEYNRNMKRDLVNGTNVKEWDTTGVRVEDVESRYVKIGEDIYRNGKVVVRNLESKKDK